MAPMTIRSRRLDTRLTWHPYRRCLRPSVLPPGKAYGRGETDQRFVPPSRSSARYPARSIPSFWAHWKSSTRLRGTWPLSFRRM